ncbi:MAG: hypothetical protein IH621_14230, partial [Krumholzibacteria bacterium]|nr:hypothetical protein [Candidatus Krumholzibacteria bacterium]
ITASHNPKDWNGIKMVRQGALALSGDAGIKEIKQAVMAGRFADTPRLLGPPPISRARGESVSRNSAFRNGEIMVKLKTLKNENSSMKTTASTACGR